MSLFENRQYNWRETYSVLFESSNRPTLEKVQQTLVKLNNRFTLTNLQADASGRADSFTVLSPDDFAALDVSYLEGDEVVEHGAELAEEMEAMPCQEDERERVARIRRCDSRFDVLHFEQVVDLGDEGPDEMFDPTALLVVLDALVKLTGGIAVDPEAGTTI